MSDEGQRPAAKGTWEERELARHTAQLADIESAVGFREFERARLTKSQADVDRLNDWSQQRTIARDLADDKYRAELLAATERQTAALEAIAAALKARV